MTRIQFSLIKKIKIGRPEQSLPPQPPTSDIISFLPPPTPRQSGRHMSITPTPITKFYNGDDIDYGSITAH